MQIDQCPHCSTSLLGEEIPAEQRREGGGTHYKREILMEIRGVYDGGLFWMCPDCGCRWHRWPEGHYLHDLAEKHIHEFTGYNGLVQTIGE